MPLVGLPKSLECLLRGLLDENKLTAWSSDWADGEITVSIKFKETQPGPAEKVPSKLIQPPLESDADTSSDSDDEKLEDVSKFQALPQGSDGTAENPRKYHLIAVENNAPMSAGVCDLKTFPSEQSELATPYSSADLVMTPSSSSSFSEDIAPASRDAGTKVRKYRPVDLREFGNTFSSSSAENIESEGLDECDTGAAQQGKNGSISGAPGSLDDVIDASRLIDII